MYESEELTHRANIIRGKSQGNGKTATTKSLHLTFC